MAQSSMTLAAYAQAFRQAICFASVPVRSMRAARFRRSRKFPISVLMYQRVSDRSADQATVSNDVFEEQIDWLQSRFELISLEEAQSRIVQRSSARPAACITFEGGSSDNHLFALPLLLRRDIPFTYFVSSRVEQARSPSPASATKDADQLEDATSVSDLAACGIPIGLRVPPIGQASGTGWQESVDGELAEGRERLQQLIGTEVKYLSCPHHNAAGLDGRIFQLARQHDWTGICSAYGGVNRVEGDGFHLQRIPAIAATWQLKSWLTWDGRVLNQPRFDDSPGASEV